MFFPDLTPYEYGGSIPVGHVLNIGWLGLGHDFSTGNSPASFVSTLRTLAASPVNLYRGSHLCEFCPKPPEFLSPNGLRTMDPPRETIGNGEIRVHGSNGVTYVAPVLIVHYVEAHGYLPPAEFVDAVAAIGDA